MPSCFRNTCAKNHYNLLILSKVTVDNVPFLRHSVVDLIFVKVDGYDGVANYVFGDEIVYFKIVHR